MNRNQIMFYNTTPNEALEMLGMESKRDFALVEMNRYEVILNKKKNHLLVSINHAPDSSIEDGIIDLKVAYPGKFRDVESIDRVNAVLALNPNSNWWKEILEDLQDGSPLGWRVESTLDEVEDRINNPDQDLLDKLNIVLSNQPRSRFFQSLMEQFQAGRELSERQLEILEQNAPQATSRNQIQLEKVEEALALEPNNRFLLSLRSQNQDLRDLSRKQLNVVTEIIERHSNPASKLLSDLKKNVSLSREDFMIIVKGQRDGIDTLDTEERKRLRHLIYKNGRRLDNTYSKDTIRTLLKKGTLMRRTASEIIRNLENRVARLESKSMR
jgi:hypothetical protein